MSIDFRLEGKLAVVTGARRGIGLEIAKALAEQGADIIALSANMEAQGSEVEQAVVAAGRKFEAITCDFSNVEEVERVAQKLSLLPVDILINNAGTIEREPAKDYSLDKWEHVISVNLTSQFVLTQAIGRQMIERKYGKIIFTASLLSFQGGINVPAYTASKSAISGLTKALSNEWASDGVCVNAIAPGYIATDNTTALRNDPTRSEQIRERIPAGRWGKPSDIAGAAVFLSSSASDYLTGVTLPVDGGWLGR